MTPDSGGVSPNTARELSRAAKQIHSFTRRRDEYVLKARAEGGSLRDIAKLAGITHRAVAKIIERTNAMSHRLTVEEADRLAQEQPPYPPPSDDPRERCEGPTKWHRPQSEDWNAGWRDSTCTWCDQRIVRRFADPIWRTAESTGGTRIVDHT